MMLAGPTGKASARKAGLHMLHGRKTEGNHFLKVLV